MFTRSGRHLARILPLLIATLALLLGMPNVAAAASTAGAGTAIEVVIPGHVSLFAFCAAGLIVLGLAIARHRPMV